MPGKLSPSKRFVSFALQRELFYKVTQYAESMGMDRSNYITSLLEKEMHRLGVKLSGATKQKVMEETKAVSSTRQTTWSRLKKKTAK